MAGDDNKGPTRALILASAVDSCFCAGADLKERKGFTQEEYVVFPFVFVFFVLQFSCIFPLAVATVTWNEYIYLYISIYHC